MYLLPQTLLEQIRARAASYDEANEFCSQDFEDLAESGYLKAAVPEYLGGAGFDLTTLTRSQRTLAKYAPATALAVNMHLLWGAVARYLNDRGDKRLEWVFDDMLRGEIFAFGISEAGNDKVLLDSFTKAEPLSDSGAYSLTGKKVFTTLSPVWTRLGVHAKTSGSDTGESATPAAYTKPEIVVGFLRRDALPNGKVRTKDQGGPGIEYVDPWNTLGMRATQSWNTELKGATLLSEDIVARFEPYDMQDPIIMAVSLCFGALTSSVYAGIADRAIELAKERVDVEDPYSATLLSEAMLAHRLSIDSLERLASDVDRQEPRDDYSVAVAAVKTQVTDEARSAVDVAVRLTGSRAFAADSELARMYRDVLAGVFHPRSSRSLAASLRAEMLPEE